MKRRQPKLHLVGQAPEDVFEDIERLRDEYDAAPRRRTRSTETFARIPHDKALGLKLSGTAWKVLIELDRIILKGRGQNPVRFWSPRLKKAGITKGTRARALRQLEHAGVVLVHWKSRGLSPWVFHLWYPKSPA